MASQRIINLLADEEYIGEYIFACEAYNAFKIEPHLINLEFLDNVMEDLKRQKKNGIARGVITLKSFMSKELDSLIRAVIAEEEESFGPDPM